MIGPRSLDGSIAHSELQEMRQPSFDAPYDIVVLPPDPTLHDISQAYVNAYCELVDMHPPTLRKDGWDKGITRDGLQAVLQAVCLDKLNDINNSCPDRVQALLEDWRAVLHEKLAALKKTDGCSGCFGRHGNSKAIESHLSAILKENLRSPQLNAFLRAARDADLNALQEGINNGLDVNASDSSGRTALMLLLQNVAGETVDACADFLLSVPDIDVHRTGMLDYGTNEANALGLAVQHGHERVARRLLEEHPGIKFRNAHGSTLINCVVRHSPGLVNYLLDAYADADADEVVQEYKLEMSRLPRQDRRWSHTFFCDVIVKLKDRNLRKGRIAELDMMIAVIESRSLGLPAIAMQQYQSGPPVNAENIRDPFPV